MEKLYKYVKLLYNIVKGGGEILKLKDLRLESGLKVKKIAKELGISRTHLYNLENGIHKVDPLKKEKLAYLYRVDICIIEEACKEVQRE